MISKDLHAKQDQIAIKERLGCVPGPLLKRYHKTSIVNLNNISSSMYFIRNNQTMKHVYQNTQALLDISIISQ